MHSSCSICVDFVLDGKLSRNWIDELLPTCKPEKARHRLLLLVLPDRTRDEHRPSVSNELVTWQRIDLWTKDGKFVSRVSRGEE